MTPLLQAPNHRRRTGCLRGFWPGALAWAWLVLALVAGCGPGATPSPTLTQAPTWPPPPRYLSPTPSHTPTVPAWPTGTLRPPTPTPLVYTIRPGDTLSELALRFGVPVEVLQRANPHLNPHAMPVGATLVVPLDPTYMPGPPTPTPPAGLQLGPVACYAAGNGGAWCFTLLENRTEQAWMHPLARLELLTWGDTATPGIRQTPMQALAMHVPPGGRLPLVAYLDSPWPGSWQARAVLERVFPLSEQTREARFVPVLVEEVAREWGPYQRWVRLEVRWQVEDPAAWVRLVAWGVGETGQVVAARGWTWEGPWEAEATGEASVYLYSLGSAMDAVHLWAEAVRTAP